MGTGWRKALCTTIQRDSELSSPEDPRSRLSPKTDGKFSFFRRSRSSPSTPRYQHRTQSQLSTPNLRIRTGPPASHTREDTFHRTDARIQAEAATPRSGLRRLKLPFLSSNPPSPRSPSRLALLLKNHLRPTRVRPSVAVSHSLLLSVPSCSRLCILSLPSSSFVGAKLSQRRLLSNRLL